MIARTTINTSLSFFPKESDRSPLQNVKCRKFHFGFQGACGNTVHSKYGSFRLGNKGTVTLYIQGGPAKGVTIANFKIMLRKKKL